MASEHVETLYEDIQIRFGLTARLRLETLRSNWETCDTIPAPLVDETGARSISGMLARQQATTSPAPTCELVPPAYSAGRVA
jgi:hypothetical protein